MIKQTLVDFPFSRLSLWRESKDTEFPDGCCARTGAGPSSLYEKLRILNSYVLTESLAVLSAGEVKMSVEVKVVGRQLGNPQDRPLTLLFDWSDVILLLRLPHQRPLQTGDHLALGVDVLMRHDVSSDSRGAVVRQDLQKPVLRLVCPVTHTPCVRR